MYGCLHLLQYGGDVTKILFENEMRGGGYNCDRFENLGGVQLIGLNISKLDRMRRIL